MFAAFTFSFAQQPTFTDTEDSNEDSSSAWSIRLNNSLSALAQEADANYYNTGLCVWDLTDDSLLFAYNQQKVMRPASTQKLITAISALSLLGAEHEYRTRAFYTGDISADSILRGDIYVLGDFDPSYSYQDIRELAQAIRDLNIRGIEGSLYADTSMKDSLLYGWGWCWDDVPCENMPYLSPLMLERGMLHPHFDSYSTDPTFHPSVEFLRTLADELSDIHADTLHCALRTINTRTSPQLIYIKTRTIADLLPHMMKSSDNLYAESMFYHIAHINKGRWANYEDAARLIENVLHKAGAQPQYTDIADGSGVSLYNYVSPQSELALLRYAYLQPHIFDVLYPALPIAGVDGTLRSRMTSGPAHRNVHAKTGTVSGVSCLSGYVTASNGHLLAFSIMNNGLIKVATGRNFQDRVCQVLAQ